MFDTLTLPCLAEANPGVAGHSAADPSRKPGLLARIAAAMIETRQRQADRHIARYIERHGGRITDSVERGILQEAIAAGSAR